MHRLVLTAALAVLLAAWVAAPAVAQGGPTVKVVFTGGTIYHHESVPPGKGHVFRVTCPPGWRPVSGGPVSFDPAAPLKASVISVPGNSWLFRYDNTSTAPITVTVMIVCAKPRPVGAIPKGIRLPLKIKIKTRTKVAVVPPLQTQTVTNRCPAGTLPVGAGSDIAPVGSRAAAPAVGGNFQGRISQWEIQGRTKTLTADNHSPDSLRVTGQLLCGDVVDRDGDDVVARVSVRSGEFHDRLKPNLNVFHHACPRGTFPLWVGWRFEAGIDALAATYGLDVRGKPVWTLFADHEAPVDLYVTCTTGSLRVLKRP